MEERQPSREMMTQRPGMATGAIVLGAVLAGLIAYGIRRRQMQREQAGLRLGGVSIGPARGVMASEQAQMVGEYVSERILPEFKPVLLAILEDLREVVNQGFDRAERRVKSW